MHNNLKTVWYALALAALAALAPSARSATINWTAGSATTRNWSDSGNWESVPGNTDIGVFGEAYSSAFTNAVGLVNNVVDASTALGALDYTNLCFVNSNHFFTTLISNGVTLTLGGLGAATPALAVGDVPWSGLWLSAGSWTNNTTITGAGTLFVNDPTSLISVGMRNRATLDLSGLNTFTASVSQLWVGATGDNPTTTGPTGLLRLAKTNSITTAANLNAPGVLLGGATNNSASGTAFLFLGGTNAFNTDGLVVGGLHAGFGTVMSFGSIFSNTAPLSTFTLRGSAGGSTPASLFSVGDIAANFDGYASNRVGGGSTSTADFSGGSVDIQVDSLFVGRSTTATNGAGSSGTGNLILEQGTITATNVFIANKITATNNTAGNGILILRSNAVLNVVKDLSLVFRTNGSAFINNASMGVSNAAVVNVGGNITYNNIGSGSPGGIGLGGGTINMTGGGSVTTAILNGFGTITNSSGITVTNAFSLGIGGGVGSMALSSNVTFGSLVKLPFKLGANNTEGGGVNDYVTVGNNVAFNNNPLNLTFGAPLVTGTYELLSYGGVQSGTVTWVNPTRSPIGLVQGSGLVGINVTNYVPANLTWKAVATNGLTRWENITTNWNNNTDRFFALDNVLFDDTGVATNIDIAGITNFPSSVTFNNSVNKYTVSQSSSGAIGGFGSLTKTGSGTLVMGGGGANNYFTGPVNINQGTIQMGSFNTGVFGTTASTNPINVAVGGMLDMNGQSIGTSASYGRPVNLAGTGIGGIGAIVHNGPSSGPALTTSGGITLTGDATVGCTTVGLSVSLVGLNAPYSDTLNLANHTLSTTGAGEVRLRQLVITNSGSITVGGPRLGLQNMILDGPGTLNLGNKILNFVNGSTTGYVAKAISVTNGFIIASSASAVPIPIGSAISIANNGVLTITNSQVLLLTNTISGTGAALTKYGTSNIVMSAANTYSGNTEIAAGGLLIAPGGSLASSPILQVDTGAFLDVTGLGGGYTIPNGQTLAASGNVLGTVTVGMGGTYSGFGTNVGSVSVSAGGLLPGGTIAPGSALVQGTLYVSNNLTFNGGTAIFKLNSTTDVGNGVNDLVAVGGNLSFTGPTVIKIQPVAGLSTQPYTLFTYGGTLSGGANVTLTSDSRYHYTLDTNTPGVVLVSISGAAGNLVWQGGVSPNPNAWDIVTTSNWLNGVNPDYFYQGDSVTFDDSAKTMLVTMAKQMKPAAMTNNGTSDYVLNGNGSLLAGTLVANSGNMIIANTNNNLFNGAGIAFNGGNVSFSQPAAASVTAKLSGGAGALNKNGANTLTLTSADSTGMYAPVNINGGTLRPASSNALGLGAVSIANNATLDLNGQAANTATLVASGAGADGLGAINNRGLAQTNAISSLTLTGDTTVGAASNRWDVTYGGAVAGNGYKLTKTGAADIWMQPASSTSLGDIDVTAGRLVFASYGTDLGTPGNALIVRSNATIGFANGIQAGKKQGLIQAGGAIYSRGSANEFDGPTVLSNGLVQLEPNAQLTLGGDLSGPANLTVQGVIAGNFGTLTLAGSNTYTGGTLVNDGELDFANSNSIPANTNIVLSSRVVYNTSGHPVVGLLSNVVSPSSVRLDMQTVGSAGPAQAWLYGNGGTWTGPIRITGADAHCTANFQAGLGGLTVAGAIDGSAFSGNVNGNGGVKILGDSVLVSDVSLAGAGVRFNNSLQFGGTLSCVNSGLGGQPGMSKMVLASAGNSWTDMFWQRGVIQVGADNALPLIKITIGTLISGADHRVIVDLNGHLLTLANWVETFLGNDPTWFGNSSTNANATLTYAGTGTNSWSAYILDAFDTSASVQKTTALSVTAGYLKLMPFPFGDPSPNDPGYFPSGPPPYPMGMTYTGPTTVSGGTLEVNKYLGLSPVVVSGAGTLRGVGPLGGTLTVSSGGTVAPGTNTIGVLTVSNNVTLNAGGTCAFRVNLTTGTNDELVVISNLTYGGTLAITNIGAQALTNGTMLKLFDAATYVAGAVTIQPSAPGSGLMWDASNLPVNGTLKVVTAVAPVVGGTIHLPDGNVSFPISGVTGQGYTVRASTDLSLPLSSWTVLQSGSLPSASYVFSDLTATNYPHRFYRVSTP